MSIDAAADFATERMRAGHKVTAPELTRRFGLTPYGAEGALRIAEDATSPKYVPAAKATHSKPLIRLEDRDAVFAANLPRTVKRAREKAKEPRIVIGGPHLPSPARDRMKKT